VIIYDPKINRTLHKNIYKNYMAQFLQFLLVLCFSLAPGIAEACSVCFSGKEETLEAFYLTTIFLTLLPLIMLASIGIWLYRQHQKAA
tara:strand:+ start:332 stop:595 length:264 start_codon:yes stop_codon:yes gene_type:complete